MSQCRAMVMRQYQNKRHSATIMRTLRHRMYSWAGLAVLMASFCSGAQASPLLFGCHFLLLSGPLGQRCTAKPLTRQVGLLNDLRGGTRGTNFLLRTKPGDLPEAKDEPVAYNADLQSTSLSQQKENGPGIWPCLDTLDKRLLKIALPVIANFAINPLIGAVDLFWVNRMGNALAVAGQAAANQIFSSAFWFASFLPSVTATFVSTENANGNKEGVQDAVCQALFVSMLFAVVGAVLLLKRPDSVLSAVLPAGAPALEYARPYLQIRALAFLPSLISLVGFSAYRGVLDTATPVKISAFANIFNAVLDPILIFGMGMGVPGAAMATLVAEVISAAAYLYLMRKSDMIKLRKVFKLPAWVKIAPLIKGGFALQLRNIALNITFLAVTRVTQAIDKDGVGAAAHAMAIQVFQVGGIVLLALSTVAQSVVPNDLVVKEDSATKKKIGGVRYARTTVNRLMSWGFLLGSLLGSLQILILPLLHKSTPLQEVRDAALVPSYLASLYQIINGLVFIGEGVMVGCGNFLQLSLSTVVATIGCLWALKTFPPVYGLTGVWMGFGVFNVLRLGGVVLHQFRNGPLTPRKIKEAEEQN